MKKPTGKGRGSQLFRASMGASAKEKASSRIRRNAKLPMPVRRYLIRLMKASPTISILTINMLLRTIPQIIVGKNIEKRRGLDEFLANKGRACFKPKPITKEEKGRHRRELIERKFFSENDMEKIMREIEKRPQLSNFGAQAIIHYFVCTKVLDSVQQKSH